MGLAWLSSIWAKTNLARHGSGPAELDIVSGRLNPIGMRADLAQHGPEWTWLDLDLGRIDSTWAQIVLAWRGPDADSTWALAHSTQLGWGFTRLTFARVLSGPTRLGFGSNRLDSTLIRTESAQYWPGPTRLDMESSWLCSWAQIDSAYPRSGSS